MTHTELCKRTAERFVKTMAIYESTMLSFERPDVLNFDSSGHTWLYEIKMSRADFLADRNKFARKELHHGQFGDFRYFVCFGDFIKSDEVPEGWGLYHFKNDKFFKVKEADRFIFMDEFDVSQRQKRNVQLLVNFIICERTNIIFAPRVLKNRIKYGNERTVKKSKSDILDIPTYKEEEDEMLIFPLKKEWFEKIKSSEKTVEYREVKDYLRKRFISHFQLDTDEMCKVGDSYIFDEKNSDAICKLRLGYTNQYMTARITKIEVVDGKDTDLHINTFVYAIHLADVKECV